MFPFKPTPKITFWTIFHKSWKFQYISVGLILLSLQTSFYYCNLRVAFDMHKWKWRESSLAQWLLPSLSSIVIKSLSSFMFRVCICFFLTIELSLPTIHLSYGVDVTAIKSFIFFVCCFPTIFAAFPSTVRPHISAETLAARTGKTMAPPSTPPLSQRYLSQQVLLVCRGTASNALLHGCTEQIVLESPLTAGWSEEGKEGPVLSPVLWKAQQVCFFGII